MFAVAGQQQRVLWPTAAAFAACCGRQQHHALWPGGRAFPVAASGSAQGRGRSPAAGSSSPLLALAHAENRGVPAATAGWGVCLQTLKKNQKVIVICNIGGTLDTNVKYRREKKIFAGALLA